MLRVTGMTVLGEAVLLVLDEDVMTLDVVVRVLGEAVLKLCEFVKAMMTDVVVGGGLVVLDESVMAVLFEIVLEELSEIVLEELDEVVMGV